MIDVTVGDNNARERSGLRTLILISAAHWVSHYYILVLPMLFPFLKTTLGVGYIELGFSLTVFAVVTGLTQAPVGYLVDRVGARKILIAGLCLGGFSLILLGLTLNYTWLLVCAVLLGIGNSVYHPSDYALLAANMDEGRMGRAFSVHTFAGYLGAAVAPAIVGALVATVGGIGALMVSGVIGLAVGLVLLVLPVPEASAAHHAQPDGSAAKVNIVTPMVIVLTVFFTLLGLSTSGISSFGVVALMSGYNEPFAIANLALTAFLGAAAVGVLAGGFLADRTSRHEQVAAVFFAINALIVAAVAVTSPGPVVMVVALTVAGFLSGVIAPSRDMMVRNAAPPGAAGRVFGIVSTGFNIGGIISPLLFGWLMDHSMPRWVFGGSAVFMLLTVLLTVATDRRGAKAAGS
ncbi:MAG TPA: MFS transporter [Xanthobacteraceae bacterium]|nr:MFS transporter [Xanthobacteraceae bacterium]